MWEAFEVHAKSDTVRKETLFPMGDYQIGYAGIEIETQGGDFKISNDYISFYARLFHARHPQHKGFFRTKPFKEEKLIEKLGEALDF